MNSRALESSKGYSDEKKKEKEMKMRNEFGEDEEHAVDSNK